ncbi:MAG: NAD regulator [Maricaulis sp.]|jgi:hypothetical protein|nr:NAD regulator [Maricaulis sp.]HAQ35115.1 NAD regulator [Alphaproteobacteria bacterium]
MSESGALIVGLNAVIVAVTDDAPQLLVVPSAEGTPALPFGPFDPKTHRTFEIGLREWVSAQAQFQLGFVEQLYTFGDQGREAPLAELSGTGEARVISIGYLALTPDSSPPPEGGGVWRDWYRFFPWEDWRAGEPAVIRAVIAPALRRWADEAATPGKREARRDRIRIAFGLDGMTWNEERVLDRYELLYETGLVPEASRDQGSDRPAPDGMGEVMASDHRRILATAISRLRAKVKYRPVVFEMMPERFTLSHLQRVMEAIVGFPLHKQNFRRALDRSGFVDGTGRMESATGGRPAELFTFRREALREGPASGLATPRLNQS